MSDLSLTPPSWAWLARLQSGYKLPEYQPKSTVRSAGFVKRTDSLPMHAAGNWATEPLAEAIVKAGAMNPSYEPEAYCIAKPSMYNTLKTFEKYDHLDPTIGYDVRLTLDTFVRPGIMESYVKLWNACSVREVRDLLYVPTTSSGPVFKSVGLKVKEDVVRKARSWLEWYVKGGFRQCPPPLYKQSGKIELLKAKKVLANDIRGFTIPPADELFLQARYLQDTQEKIDHFCATHDVYAAVGFNIRRGGLMSLGEQLRSHSAGGGVIWKGDIVKFDGSQCADLILWDIEFCEKLWDRQVVSPEEWASAMNHIVHNMIHTFVLLPNGQILVKVTGLPSGALSTSNTGCRVHEQALGYHWTRMTDKPFSKMVEHVRGRLYSDDHLFAVDAEYDYVADFDERRRSYEIFGLTLSEEEDLVSSTADKLEGMSFLGFGWGENYWPLPMRQQKFYHGLSRPDGPRDVNTGLQRAVSFMGNSVFDPPRYKLALQCAKMYQSKGASWLWSEDPDLFLGHIPTRQELIAQWTGYESGEQHHGTTVKKNYLYPGADSIHEIDTLHYA